MSTAVDVPARSASRSRVQALIAVGLALVAATAWIALSVSQWRALVVPSWDLGIFTQLADAYAQPRAPIVDIKGVGTHLLGDHWHPILVLLGPIYRLWPSGLTLLVVQDVLFAASTIPLARAAMERLGTGLGAAAGAAYALSWGFASAVWAQFHEIAVAVPLLSLSLAAYLRGRWRSCALWALPLVAVKEDLGLTVAALGLVLLLRAVRDVGTWRAAGPTRLLRTDSGRWGAVLIVWGLAWLVLTITALLPLFNAEGQWDYTARLEGSDEGSGGPLAHLLEQPGTKLATLAVLVASAGVVGAASPLVLVMVPTLAWRFLGEVPMYWGTSWHYSAVLIPVATAALVDVAARLRAAPPRGGPPRDARSGEPRTPLGSLSSRRALATLAVAISLATTVASIPAGPLARLAQPDAFAESWRAEPLRSVAAELPPGASVTTDLGPLAYLVPHAQVRWVGNAATDPAPEYVLLDEYAAAAAGRGTAADWAQRTWPGTRWEPMTSVGGYHLARQLSAPQAS